MDGKPIIAMAEQSTTAKTLVTDALPNLNASQPVNGIPMTAPMAMVNNSVPSDEWVMPNDSCSSGRRDAQLAYMKPLKKKNAETVMRWIFKGVGLMRQI